MSLASAACAGPVSALAAGRDPAFAGAPAVERPGLASARLCLPVAERLHQVLPAFSAEQARLALPAVPENVAALRGYAAGNGISGYAAPFAAPLVLDTDPLNTAAGIRATGRVLELRGGPICPNRFYDVPIHVPSAHSSVVVHRAATRGSTQEAGGSSAQGFAG